MAVAHSQNGWPALTQGSALLHTWVIPAKTGTFKLTIRNGSAGFILAHYALWYAETVETVAGKVVDDWGWAYRPIRGQSSGLSNHASGTAIDLNAEAHVLGAAPSKSFTPKQIDAIHSRLRWLRGCLRWGGDYSGRKDSMHTEVVQSLPFCEIEAKRLINTPRGRRLLNANPGQKAVILS